MQIKEARKYQARTKIIATVGPVNSSRDRLMELARAGVDVFRLNFAHGTYEFLVHLPAVT